MMLRSYGETRTNFASVLIAPKPVFRDKYGRTDTLDVCACNAPCSPNACLSDDLGRFGHNERNWNILGRTVHPDVFPDNFVHIGQVGQNDVIRRIPPIQAKSDIYGGIGHLGTFRDESDIPGRFDRVCVDSSHSVTL